MQRIFLLLFFMMLSHICFAQGFVGKWYGTINHDTLVQLKISANLDTLPSSCDFFTTTGDYINVPLKDFNLKNDLIKFKFATEKGTNYSYKGKYDDKTHLIKGSLSVKDKPNKLKGDFELVFGKEKPAINKKNRASNIKIKSKKRFTRQDTLRGSVTPEREWWDLVYYHLKIKLDIEEKSISGSNTVKYKVLKEGTVMQIDLQEPLSISRVWQGNDSLEFKRVGNVYFITLKEEQEAGTMNEITIEYGGKPRAATNPPWDGGFTWGNDNNRKPFVATSCQGIGASIWWPNKDHMYDEVDSMKISVNVPDSLVAVSNGKLQGIEEQDDSTKTYHWFVANPINNYGVALNVADYAHFDEQYIGEKDTLACDYYVLKDNLERAKKHFKQVGMMLEAFEHWFGPYPFYEDGYKLIETPFLGMEHQGAIAYGNHYYNGYLWMDISNTGWGHKFDYIIIHESGHEWFGNNITYKDIADMWVHEAFTVYSEGLYLEYHFSKEAGEEYLRGCRGNILNNKPIIGLYYVNHEGSSDMYYKGANMLHTLRQLVDNDSLWLSLLRGLNKDFYHKTVTTQEIENYMAEKTGLELGAFFDQYLRTVKVPTLEYFFEDDKLAYRWINSVEGFNMPLKIYLNGKQKWIQPKPVWTYEYLAVGEKLLMVDANFYVKFKNIIKD